MTAPAEEVDVIVIGSGAGGATVAAVLSEAGRHVLLLERGKNLAHENISFDHLRNHRLALYGHNTGPEYDGHPRVFVEPDGTERTVQRPFDGAYNNNAMTVGGGTRVFGAQAWRFHPHDFRMASVYGVPEGSSLCDWPISYDDLEPFYEQAEREVGVAGDASQDVNLPPRKNPLPMPPMPDSKYRATLKRGAQKLGWSSGPVPVLINSVPYNGRPACVHCEHCIGFSCGVDARNGSNSTMLPRALKSGRCELRCEAQVSRIHTDTKGRATGVTYIVVKEGEIKHIHFRAKAVVVSAGAIESARLLLLSANAEAPRGLGNAFDQVGRNLQGHYYPGALGVFDEALYEGIGPGVSIATTQFNHGNAGVVGGAMLADEFVKLPIIFWRQVQPPGMPTWGAQNKRFARENFARTIHVQGPVQEIPSADCRVTLDQSIRDKFGLPVARLSGTTHAETVRTAKFMQSKAEEWLRESGAKQVWGYHAGQKLSAGQHQAGTCRMGRDPKHAVCDSFGGVFGHENLYVVDGSVHPTNGGFNPVLTIFAQALRAAGRLNEQLA
jgi:choline dehydrogenase-like flavoprotein